MKKFFMFALAAVAMSFAGCGGQTSRTAELDSLTIDVPAEEPAAETEANAVIAMLQEQLQQADPEQVKAISTQIAQQVAQFVSQGDEASANKYAALIGDFISTNMEKLQQTGVTSAIAEALSQVEGLPTTLMDVAMQSALKVDTAAATVRQAVDAAPDALKDAAKEQAGKVIDDAARAAKEQLGL